MRRWMRRTRVFSLYWLKSWPSRARSSVQILVKCSAASRVVRRLPIADSAEMLRVCEQPLRHLLDRHHLIDETGRGGAARHTEQCRFVEPGLRETETAMLLDGLQAQRAVTAAARENDADGLFLLIFGERSEEDIDRLAVLARRRRCRHAKSPALDRHHGVRRDDEDMVRGERHAVLGLHHRHLGVIARELDQQALVMRVEMLDQDERHAALRRHVREEALEGIEPAGGSAETDEQPGREVPSPGGPGCLYAWSRRCSFRPLRRIAIAAPFPALLPLCH
jgi:hypothetical protein